MLDRSCESATPSEPGDSADYVARINRAIDHVLTHLDQPLQLDAVAAVACFSTFHFHRIFRAVMGETVHQFVKRLRLERSLRLMSRHPGRSLTEVALACGFNSSSDFSRSFRQRYGVPPSVFEVETFREQKREEWVQAIEDPEHRHQLRRLPVGENPDGFEVSFVQLPPRRVAYIRVLDPYRPDVVPDAASRLVQWAQRRQLEHGSWLGYMWDDPDVVAHEDCRYDAGVEAPEAQADGEVGVIEFPAMTLAQVEVRGPIDLEMRALDWMWGTWLPQSGYVPSDQPCFESWIGEPFAHGMEHFELFVQIPVEPA